MLTRSSYLLMALVTVAGLAVSVLTVSPAQAGERIVELAPTSMGYTDLFRPGWISTDEPDVRFSRLRYRTYLNYDLSSLGSKDEIVAAEFGLTVSSSGATEPGVEIRAAAADWSPDQLSYDHAPQSDGPLLNPVDTVVPRANNTSWITLSEFSGLQPGTSIGLAVEYNKSFVAVAMPKATAPKLRLTIRSADPVTPVDPTALPYEVAKVDSAKPKVFAHYFPPYPISLDNADPAVDYYATQYLRGDGEGGKWKAVGGLLRDRPVGRPPIDGDYRMVDASTEVSQAASSGIHGFTVNILSWSGDLWDQTLTLNRAAARSDTGFVTVPNIDMTSQAGAASVATMADRLAEFYASPAAYRLPDGRYALSSFKAEVRTPGWWRELFSQLQERHGISVAFIGVMLHLNEARIKAYAPISYALSIWGVRTAKAVMEAPNFADAVHRAGVAWMAPIAIQDVRHKSLIYAEAGNTETLRASWTRAMADRADMVQIITWNDYSESTQLAPSEAHQRAFLDLNGYYATQFKNNATPDIVGDELIVNHRIQRFNALPTKERATMSWQLSGSGTPPRDTVEVLSMLRSPALVVVRVGAASTSYLAPQGLSWHTVPLELGSVSVRALRDGAEIAAVRSPYEVVRSLENWDLQYYAATSRPSRER